MNKILIVGGGPAGMMAAISARLHHPHSKVLLFERNPSLGRKLLLSGGGRCNITAAVNQNEIIKNIPHNGKFLFSALHQFDAQAIMAFFEKRSCPLSVEDHHRVFPESGRANDVLKVLKKELEALNVVRVHECVSNLDLEKRRVSTANGTYDFDHLILATGGVSVPQTGSDGLMFQLLKTSKHRITTLRPAETPLISQAPIIQSKALMGLSFKDVPLTLWINDKKIVTITHDFIFTHFGLSGPGALSLSSYCVDALALNAEVKVTIDFSQGLILDEKNPSEIIDGLELLPKRLMQVMDTLDGGSLLEKLQTFTLTIHDVMGFNRAFVTKGGVDVKEVNPKTMQSKLYPWLSFGGEMLDVNGFTGGYNMTIAFATGYVAGKHALTNYQD